jgi:hypothetical protein
MVNGYLGFGWILTIEDVRRLGSPATLKFLDKIDEILKLGKVDRYGRPEDVSRVLSGDRYELAEALGDDLGLGVVGGGLGIYPLGGCCTFDWQIPLFLGCRLGSGKDRGSSYGHADVPDSTDLARCGLYGGKAKMTTAPQYYIISSDCDKCS